MSISTLSDAFNVNPSLYKKQEDYVVTSDEYDSDGDLFWVPAKILEKDEHNCQSLLNPRAKVEKQAVDFFELEQ